MNGFGCHTFSLVNKEGKRTYCKFNWLSKQGTKNFTMEEATRMMGEDPDFAKRDLWDHIEGGGTADWTLALQLMTPEEAAQVDFDPFDVTKVWPRAQFPLQEVGELSLNRNPEDYHRDVEQAAFSPGSYVPGIETSPDTLLNWRNFFYRDAQIHRLGSANIHQIPVNCPFLAKQHSPDNYAGNMRIDGNTLGKPIYFPNSYSTLAPKTGTAPSFDPTTTEAPWQLASNVVSRASHYRHEGQPSEYDQVRELYQRVLSVEERTNLHNNTGKLLKVADNIVIKNYLIQLYAIDPLYAEGVLNALPAEKRDQFDFSFDEVKEKSATAHLVGKNPQFLLKDKGATFMGMPVGGKKMSEINTAQYEQTASCPFGFGKDAK